MSSLSYRRYCHRSNCRRSICRITAIPLDLFLSIYSSPPVPLDLAMALQELFLLYPPHTFKVVEIYATCDKRQTFFFTLSMMQKFLTTGIKENQTILEMKTAPSWYFFGNMWEFGTILGVTRVVTTSAKCLQVRFLPIPISIELPLSVSYVWTRKFTSIVCCQICNPN